jgi:hypothetical protein
LLLTSAEPTPSDLGVPVLDVAYEYNINSDAPVDPLNPFALGNSLAAYAYGYGQESTALNITQAVDTEGNKSLVFHGVDGDVPLKPGRHYIVKNGKIINGDGDPVDGTTTYVTVATDELPLTRPLRLLPGGDILADTIDPTMTQLVNAGYNDGKGIPGDEAIPKDPTVTRPMQPGSSLTGLGGVPGSVPEGLGNGADTAVEDVSDPTTFVSKPLGEAGKLPVISSLPGLSSASLPNSSVATAKAGAPIKAPPILTGLGKNNSATGSTTTGTNVATNFTDQVKKAVDKVTGGLTSAKSTSNADNAG